MEMRAPHELFEIDDPSQVGAVRRRAALLAGACGLDEARASDVAVVATEVTSNVCKHARAGAILLGVVEHGGVAGLAILAIDRGPGMDLARCLVDGVSSTGTAGAGLGAIARLTTRWDAWSQPGHGTVLTATILPRTTGRGDGTPDRVGAAWLPYPGETVSGDAWAVAERGGVTTVLVVDGLGHGPNAAVAARAVATAFRERPEDPPARILERAHVAARGTRGAAASIARLDRDAGTVVFAGCGNVAGWVADGAGALRPMLGQHGTLGHAIARVREESYPLAADGLAILASDGLKSRLDLAAHAGVLARAPATIAGLLWRDFARGRDDATVVVARPGAPR